MQMPRGTAGASPRPACRRDSRSLPATANLRTISSRCALAQAVGSRVLGALLRRCAMFTGYLTVLRPCSKPSNLAKPRNVGGEVFTTRRSTLCVFDATWRTKSSCTTAYGKDSCLRSKTCPGRAYNFTRSLSCPGFLPVQPVLRTVGGEH